MEAKAPEPQQWLSLNNNKLESDFYLLVWILKSVSWCQFKGVNKIFKCVYTGFHSNNHTKFLLQF